MSFVTYAIVLTCMLLGCLATVGVRANEGPSTYNFYFQKAPGPVTVNQGGAAAAAPVVVAPAPEAEISRNKKFYLALGYAAASTPSVTNLEIATGQANAYQSGQYALKGEYELTDHFALTGEVFKLQRQVSVSGSYHYTDGIIVGDNRRSSPNFGPQQASDVDNVIDYSLGVAANLVRLRSTTFSLITGAITVPFVHYIEDRPGYSSIKDGVQHKFAPYAGARLRLIADNVWGLDLSYRALIGTGMSSAVAALTFAL